MIRPKNSRCAERPLEAATDGEDVGTGDPVGSDPPLLVDHLTVGTVAMTVAVEGSGRRSSAVRAAGRRGV